MTATSPSTWTIVDRGSFIIGTCELCGWTSPARRAYATAEREGIKHAAVCEGSAEPVPTPSSEASDPTAAAAVD